MDEPIVEFLKRKLLEAGPARWEQIAESCGVAKTLPRKIAYGDRDNPGVQTIQPLITYFQNAERAAARASKRTSRAAAGQGA